jgi:hypothetical protein
MCTLEEIRNNIKHACCKVEADYWKEKGAEQFRGSRNELVALVKEKFPPPPRKTEFLLKSGD